MESLLNAAVVAIGNNPLRENLCNRFTVAGSILGRGAWMQAGSVLGYGVRVEAGTVLAPGAALSAE